MAQKTIADRRRRFLLERPEEVSDGAGGIQRTYVTIASIWGTLEALGASRSSARDIADRREIASIYKIATPHNQSINGRNRLRLGQRVFNILSAADPDGRMKETIIVAQEIIP